MEYELFFRLAKSPNTVFPLGHHLSRVPDRNRTKRTRTQQLLPLPSNYQLIDDPKRWIITINQTALKEKR